MTETPTINLGDRRQARNAIAKDVTGGMTAAAAAKKHVVSITQVYASCAEFGVKVRSNKSNTAQTCRILFELIETEATLREISGNHGVSQSRIFKVLTHARNAGFKFEGRQDRRAGGEES